MKQYYVNTPLPVGSSGYANFTVETSSVFKVKVYAYNTKLDMVKKSPVFLDPLFCSVHLINDGFGIQKNNLTVEFLGRGPATEFECSIDLSKGFSCESILLYMFDVVTPHSTGKSPLNLPVASLTEGSHLFRVVPRGCDGKGLAFRFNV